MIRCPRPVPRSSPGVPSRRRLFAVSGCLVLMLGLAELPARAQSPPLDDVYFKVHVDQRFKYYVFVDDVAVWENQDLEGPLLGFSSARDSIQVDDIVSLSASFTAAAGKFTADLTSDIDAVAGRGIAHWLFNSLAVDVYVRGTSGTPYRVLVAGTGQVLASRQGGLPGSLQPVNGTASASFMDSTAYTASSAVVSKPVSESATHAGLTTGEITVGTETYSCAGTYTFSAPTSIAQSLCILGCMVQPATFEASASGHVELEAYPCTESAAPSGGGSEGAGAQVLPCSEVPSEAPAARDRAGVLRLQASPNPFNPATVLTFRAPAGQRTGVEVFDARGRRAARIFDGPATGEPQAIPWRAAGLPSGLYFVRIQSGGLARTEKLSLLK